MHVSAEYKSAITAALAQFKSEFPGINESAESLVDSLISRSIGELKKMTDFLTKAFTIDLPAPKRNSKISLSRWVAKVFLEASELDSTAEELLPFEDAVMPEILEPEAAPVYDICLLGDRAMDRCRVSKTPPYLIDSLNNLYAKGSFQSGLTPVNYFQVPSEHLSNIQRIGPDTVEIELLSEDLSLGKYTIGGVPPSHLITREGGAYKRIHRVSISQNSVVKYCQLIAEHISNISVV